jgi:hypothetical protein
MVCKRLRYFVRRTYFHIISREHPFSSANRTCISGYWIDVSFLICIPEGVQHLRLVIMSAISLRRLQPPIVCQAAICIRFKILQVLVWLLRFVLMFFKILWISLFLRFQNVLVAQLIYFLHFSFILFQIIKWSLINDNHILLWLTLFWFFIIYQTNWSLLVLRFPLVDTWRLL